MRIKLRSSTPGWTCAAITSFQNAEAESLVDPQAGCFSRLSCATDMDFPDDPGNLACLQGCGSWRRSWRKSYSRLNRVHWNLDPAIPDDHSRDHACSANYRYQQPD